METKNTVNELTRERFVITKDGIRMSYDEYLDMVRSERN